MLWRLGAGQPGFGVLFADMAYDNSGMVSPDRLLQPKARGEIAFVPGAGLDDGDLSLTMI